MTQGIIDLTEETWEAAGLLTGLSALVAGEPYELRIVVPTVPDEQTRDLARRLEQGNPRAGLPYDGL